MSNHMEVMKRIVKDSKLSKNEIRVLLAILSFSRKQKKQIARSYLSHLLNISPHRWNEGFRLKDFLHVHKVKTEEWKSKVDMNKYLRPETLYSNKFHSYVNEKLKEEIEKIAEQEKMNSPETQEDIEYLRMLTGNTKQLN
jgi:uncharacterized phage protein (TIGR02220 family)